MRPVPQIAVDFVRAHEGCKLAAYADVANKWTVGVGHCGPEVKPGLVITDQQADDYLRSDLAVAAQRLAGVASADVLARLTDHQYAALLSFVFNLGCRASWGIWALLNAGALPQVPAELQRFVYAAGKVVPGLVNRRAAEVALWNTPDAPAPQPTPAPAVVAQAAPPSTNSGWLSRLWNRLA